MIYSILHFHAGVKPLAGYASMICITLLKEKWVQNLEAAGHTAEAGLVRGMVTDKGFVGGLPFFFKRVDGAVKTLYAADLFFDGGVGAEYFKKVLEMPYRDFLSIGLTDLYDYYTQEYIPEDVHIQPTITFDDMAELVFGGLI
jgi:hypothetical protein